MATSQWLANVPSFQDAKANNDYLIEYNSDVADVFIVKTAHGHVRNFISSIKGLYYADFSKAFNYIVSQTI